MDMTNYGIVLFQPTISNPRVRALFNYVAPDDPLNPCPEAGLSFRKGKFILF